MSLFSVIFDIQAQTASFESSMKRVESQFGELQSIVKQTAGVIGAAFSVASLAEFADSTLRAADALYNASQRTGVAVQALSELDFAAKSSGVSTDELTASFAQMQKSLVKGSDVFSELGINLDRLKDLSPDEQFEAIAEAISKVPDPAERAADAMQIFGRSGAELLPLLSQGAQGIEKLRDEADQLGAAFGPDVVARMHEASEAIEKMRTARNAAGTSALGAVSPGITGISNFVTEAFAGTTIQQLQRQLDALQKDRDQYSKEGWLAQFVFGLVTPDGSALDARIADVTKHLQDMKAAVEGSAQRQAAIQGAVGNPTLTPYDGSGLEQFGNDLDKQANEALNEASKQYAQMSALQSASIEQMLQGNKDFLNQENADTQTGLEKQLAARDRYQSQLEDLVRTGTLGGGITQDEANKRLAEYDQTNDLTIQPINVTAKRIAPALTQMQQLAEQASKSMATDFEQFFEDPVSVGFKGLAKDFIQVVDQMIAKWATLQLFGSNGTSGPLGGIISSLFDAGSGIGAGDVSGDLANAMSNSGIALQGLASGGPVSAGMPYLVGEKGAELFSPSTAGTITPNSALGGLGGTNFAPVYNIDARGATTDLVQALPGLLKKTHDQAISTMLDLRRQGKFAAGPLA